VRQLFAAARRALIDGDDLHKRLPSVLECPD